MNSIKWSPKAVKQLFKLDRADQIAIRDAVAKLASMPDARNVRALVNYQYQFRLRVGGYRVFFDFDGAAHIVYLEEVRKRDDRTY